MRPLLSLALFLATAPAHAAATLTTLYSFTGNAPDGQNPGTGLTLVGKTLYGTFFLPNQLSGGVYAISTTTGAETAIIPLPAPTGLPDNDYAFADAPMLALGRTLYGVTRWANDTDPSWGTLFSVNTSTNTPTLLHAFAATDPLPEGGLASNGAGLLYGLSTTGIFSFDTATSQFATVYTLPESATSYGPIGTPAYLNGTLYGELQFGGLCSECGALFAYNTTTATFTILHQFAANGRQGEEPQGGLVNVNGTLYGVTGFSSISRVAGTLFEYTPATSAFSIDYKIPTTLGAITAFGGPLLALNGALYFPTSGGDGTGAKPPSLLKFNLTTHRAAVLYSFTAAPLSDPVGGLIARGKYLYGATEHGGSPNCDNGCGTVFKFLP
jgi:uncharacterized repeat protein (TIGR03803 family)